MKKIGFLGWLFVALAIFGAFVLLVWGRLIRAAWYAMGSDSTSKAQKAELDASIGKVEAQEVKKSAAAGK